jgi:peptide/nickel transport system substrate-binding protein
VRKFLGIPAVLVVALVLALGVAACGSNGGDQAKGGSMTIALTSQPDALDPALAYVVESFEPLWVVYTPLLTYRHAEGTEGAELIPGLAEELPRISNGNKTYTLNLRKGLKYSDGSPVKASDFEHSIKRVLNLESSGSSYFEGIKGGSAYLAAGNPDADIPGIQTDDKTGEIVIDLIAPDASFSNVLAMTVAGVVPGDTPFENMTKDPPPGVGPYTITKSEPNREFVLEKNPEFAALEIPDIPEGKIQTITTKIGSSLVQQTEDVINNRIDYMQAPPAADLKSEVLERFGPDGTEEQRYEEFPTPSTDFFFLNTRIAPFDDQKVREAVNVGVDKGALARLYAGSMAPGCSFLPPGMPGYSEALDLDDCPWGDPNQPPNVERAKELIREAGAEGAEVTVWGYSDEPAPKVTQAYADQLNQLGLDAEPKIIDGAVYFQTVGNEKTEAQTGPANWYTDFPHPLGFFLPLADGESIQPTNNTNLSYVDDKRINDELAELSEEPNLAGVTDRWEVLNEYFVDSAYMVPYGHSKLATFVSDRINFDECTLVHPVYQNDYSSFCLKSDE